MEAEKECNEGVEGMVAWRSRRVQWRGGTGLGEMEGCRMGKRYYSTAAGKRQAEG